MKKLLIINAIIWAVLLLANAYLFKDSENYRYMFAILIIGFSLSNGFTYEIFKKVLAKK